MSTTQAMPLRQASAPVPVRKITSHDLREVLKEGLADMLEKRGDILFLALIYPLIGLAAAIVSLGGNLLPLLFPFTAGVALLGPVAAVGFYELARRREAGLESDWSHFFDVRKRPAWDSILAVTGLLLSIFAIWVAVAATLYAMLIGGNTSTLDFLNRLFTTREGWELIVIGNLIGLGFAVLVLTLSVVSLPMLVDRNVDARTAVATSIHAVGANKAVMARWGVTVAALLVLGSIPLFVGLAVVLPWLGYSTWHLYTRLVDRSGIR
jgi:uncharacterized membrane protein